LFEIGDIVKLNNPFHGTGVHDHHGIVVKVNKEHDYLEGHIVVRWFGIFNDRHKAHPPSDIVPLKKINKNT